jgi:hypothetical protein
MATTPPVANTTDFFTKLKELFDQPMLQIVPEIAHLSPIIFILGATFISIITLNYPLGIFAASSVEALLFYNVISLVSSYLASPTDANVNTNANANANATATDINKCKSYFQLLTPSRFKSLIDQGLISTFPNKAVYFISFAAAYCIQSMKFFNEEISNFGPSYSNRPYMSIIGASMFIALYVFYLLRYGCNSLVSLSLTILFGILVGIIISNQNYGIFGKDAVNLLFIPFLQQKSGMDYICVSSQ